MTTTANPPSAAPANVQPKAPSSDEPGAHLTAPLVRVRMGTDYHLHLPDRRIEEPTGKFDQSMPPRPIMRVLFDFGQDTYRGSAGYVVDWTQPLERLWCKGQEFKLENVPEAELASAKPTPHTHPQAVIALQKPAVDAERKALADKQAAEDTARKTKGSAQQPVKRFKEIEA